MSDALAVITRVIAEHYTIREHVKLAGDTVNDIEALATLRKAHSGWTQSSTQTLIEKQKQAQQAISSLEQGLKNHFAYEETALPPLFGEILTRVLIHEHREISRQIEKAKTMLVDTKLEGLDQKTLLSKKSGILGIISHLCQAVEEHASREEIILNMIKKTLEGENDTRSSP
jgi:hypothetical protein